MCDKPFKEYHEQISILEEKYGLLIDDKDFAVRTLIY